MQRFKNFTLILFAMIGLLMIGASLPTWIEQADWLKPKAIQDGTINLPQEISVTVGEPQQLRADTAGTNVVWMSLDQEIKLRPLDRKAVWVYGTKPGEYRITAWSSVNNKPTMNSICVVKVTDPDKITTVKQDSKPSTDK
jgi:hypothetical protein